MRTIVWCLAVVAALLLPAVPASGHASAQLPHAVLDAAGDRVTVTWTAAADDAADIGVGLGLFDEDAVWALLGTSDASPPTEAEIRRFSRSPELRAYLTENVQVRQDDRPCDPEVEVADDFLAEGAQLRFTCPRPVEVVTLRVTVLHDRDDLYETYSVDGTVRFARHTVAEPEHAWDLTPARDGRAGIVAIGLGLVAALAAGAVGLRFVRPETRGGAS